ncbi:MFS transporter [Pseudomonas gingeri]|uniref:MFS transporter n=1 Tax=Pseudomonas gingeri TaxID=117681 RepID=UPI0015B9B9AF|nr:MFS transporter [Pseudomonas gingeri]NWD47647.1 MFS transporter [Pseudomonas gingeri]
MQGFAPTPALQSRHYKRSCLLLVTCISLISFFPLNVLLPAFPALAEQFNTSTVDIALAISLFTLIFAFSQLVAGPLSDRFGRKEVLLGCLAISFVGALGCTLATDFAAFLFFRGVRALGCGFFVLGLALVEDLFDKEDRALIRIYYMSFSGLFVALSPLLGSWLLESFGWKSSFHAFALIAAGIFLLALRVLTSRSAAISAAMLLFSTHAGTAASAGNTIMFLTAAGTSAVLAMTGAHVLPAIAAGLITFSLAGLLSSARVSR